MENFLTVLLVLVVSNKLLELVMVEAWFSEAEMRSELSWSATLVVQWFGVWGALGVLGLGCIGFRVSDLGSI